MDYLILKTTDDQHWCINNVTRAKSKTGEDSIMFTCSGITETMPITRVLSITPTTPI